MLQEVATRRVFVTSKRERLVDLLAGLSWLSRVIAATEIFVGARGSVNSASYSEIFK